MKLLGSVLFCLSLSAVSHAEIITITYTPADTYNDGSTLPIANISKTNLWCNDTKVAGHMGATGRFDTDLPDGIYTCYAVHTAINALGNLLAGEYSNEVIKVVGLPVEVRAGPPKNLQVVP